jgi:predicted transcriptional regulator of viral defense system
MQSSAKKIVYSHETALFFHRLTDRTPSRYSITVPSYYKPSKAVREKCGIYYVKPDMIDIGVVELPSGMGHNVTSYNVERTICDVIRSRNRIDSQIVADALKRYAAMGNKDLNRLADYARRFWVYKLLRQYLEVLL